MTDESSAHRAWRVTEPLHALIYFVPEAPERYAALGVEPAAGYFASRAAVFGAVGAGPGDRDLLQLQPRPGTPGAARRLGEGDARPRCWRPGWTRRTRRCGAVSATRSARRRWPRPPIWPAVPPNRPRRRAAGPPAVRRARRAALAGRAAPAAVPRADAAARVPRRRARGGAADRRGHRDRGADPARRVRSGRRPVPAGRPGAGAATSGPRRSTGCGSRAWSRATSRR